VRGRGLLIISRLADDFDVAPAGDGTEVRVGFWRPSERDDAEAVGISRAA
jgi:hypothetical protein